MPSLFTVGTETARMWVLVIAGLGDENGVMHVLTSATPDSALLTSLATQWTAASVTAHPVLPNNIPIPPQTIGVLDTLGSDSGITIRIPRTETLGQLIDSDGPAFIETSAIVQTLREQLTSSETQINVTDGSNWSGVSSDSWIWINGEAMRVESQTSNTLTVTRGVMATRAAVHPYVPEYPAYVLASLPRVVGARALLYEGTTADDAFGDLSLRWTGVVGDIGAVGAEALDIPIQSQWERLKQRLMVQMPALNGGPGSTLQIRTSADEADRYVFSPPPTLFDSQAETWTHMVLRSGDAWFLFKIQTLATVSDEIGTLQLWETTDPSRPVAAGIGDSVLPPDRWREVEAAADVVDNGGDLVVRGAVYRGYAFTDADDLKISAIFEALLTGTSPGGGIIMSPGGSLDLTSDEVDTASFSVLDDAIGGSLSHPVTGGTTTVVLPPFDGPILAWLVKRLRALGCGLVLSETGKITAIDWRQRLVSSQTITEPNLTTPRFSTRRQSSSVLARVVLDAEVGALSVSDIVSALASSLYQGGREIEIDCSWIDHLCVPGAPVHDRWVRQLLWGYERARRILDIRVSGATATITPGDTIGINVDAIPDHDGTVDLDDHSTGVPLITASAIVSTPNPPGAVVLSVGQAAGTDDEQAIRALLGAQVGEGATYSPALEIDGNQSGGPTNITVQANAFTDAARTPADDRAGFDDISGVAVYLLDEFGTRQDDNAPTLTPSTATTVVVSEAFENSSTAIDPIEDGWVIVVADYDDAGSAGTSEDIGWLAGDDGGLGTGGASADRYE